MTQRKTPLNAVEVLQELAERIADTSPKQERQLIEGDVVIKLLEGPLADKALRFSYRDNFIRLTVHSIVNEALDSDHFKYGLIWVILNLASTEVTDPFQGKLYREEISVHNLHGDDLLWLNQMKLSMVVTNLQELIGGLRCYHIWHSELSSSRAFHIAYIGGWKPTPPPPPPPAPRPVPPPRPTITVTIPRKR